MKKAGVENRFIKNIWCMDLKFYRAIGDFIKMLS